MGRGTWRERVVSIWRGLRYGKLKKRDVEREKLESWLEREMCAPKLLPGAKGGRKLRCSWLVVLLSRVMRECGVTADEAWWMRFSDLAWVKLAWDELDGAEFELLTDELAEELKELGWTDEDLEG